MFLNKIAFAGSGVKSWEALAQLIMSETPWMPSDSWDAKPECLSARAMRRVSPQTRLVLSVAEKIGPYLDASAAWVFASSVGEGEALHAILEALRAPDMMVQPLKFQNSIHSAAASQWSIAAGITGPITSIAAMENTAGTGFLKAVMQVHLENRPVGLVIHDVPLPPPLDERLPLGAPFSAGFALSPQAGPGSLASFEVTVRDQAPSEPASVTSRDLKRTGNPVTSVLPLLELLADRRSGEARLGLQGCKSISIDVVLI